MRPHRIEIDEVPCKKLGYCPYGYLVEEFLLKDERDEQSCPIYGHDCPVFYAAEVVDVPEGGHLYLKANWRGVLASAPEETRKTGTMAILHSAGVKPVAVEGDTVILSFRYAHHKAIMEQPINQHIADQIMSNAFGRPMHVWGEEVN